MWNWEWKAELEFLDTICPIYPDMDDSWPATKSPWETWDYDRCVYEFESVSWDKDEHEHNEDEKDEDEQDKSQLRDGQGADEEGADLGLPDLESQHEEDVHGKSKDDIIFKKVVSATEEVFNWRQTLVML